MSQQAGYFNDGTPVMEGLGQTEKVVWHNPQDKKIWLGTIYTTTGPEPTYDIPAYDMKKHRQAMKLIKEGKRKDELAESLIPWSPELLPAAMEYEARLKTARREGKLRVAGIGTNTAFSTIDLVNVTTKVLGLEFPNRVLIESVMTIDTPSTMLKVDVGTPYEGHAKAGELYTPEPQRQTYTRTDFNLPKNIATFGLTDEAQLKASHNIYMLHVENAPQVLIKIENKTLATLLETATDVSGADWGTVTAGLSDNNPLDQIRGTLDTISGNGGSLADYSIALHNRPWTDFIGNTFVRGAYNRQEEGIGGTGRVMKVDLLPGATLYIDNDKTNTIATVYAKDAFVRANGPTMVAQWRDENMMVERYRAAHFNLTKLVQSGRARDLTGVSA